MVRAFGMGPGKVCVYVALLSNEMAAFSSICNDFYVAQAHDVTFALGAEQPHGALTRASMRSAFMPVHP